MAKDIIHNPVKNALVKDGWTITHDPYTIRYGEDRTYADLAAERPSASSEAIVAEQAGRKIAKSLAGRSAIQNFQSEAIAAKQGKHKIVVEIKSFVGRSAMQDFEQAFGQYMLYLSLLAEVSPEYKLYLAISDKSYLTHFQGDVIQFMVQKYRIPLIVVKIASEEIVRWIH